MKKVNVVEFCEFINEYLETFQEDMESRNFSNRNQREWFKLLGDYLGVSNKREGDDDDENDLDYKQHRIFELEQDRMRED